MEEHVFTGLVIALLCCILVMLVLLSVILTLVSLKWNNLFSSWNADLH